MIVVILAALLAAAWLGISLLQHFSVNFIAPIPAAEPETTRVACVGDSIAYGMLLWNRANNCWPAQLQDLLGDAYSVRNFGANSTTVLHTGDHPYAKHKVYALSSDFEPDIVVIQLGLNDAKPENWKDTEAFKADSAALAEHYMALPSAPAVILLSPPAVIPSEGKVSYNIQLDALEDVVAATEAVAQEKGLAFIDVHGPMEGHSEYFSKIDGVHPNKDGTRFIARRVESAITGNFTKAGAE